MIPDTHPFRSVICDLDGVLASSEGPPVHDDAVAALARWCRGQLRCAVISTELDAAPVLEAAGLLDRVDVVIDARRAAALGLHDRRALLELAIEELGTIPDQVVALAECVAGIRAGREADLGLVAGVDRNGHRRDLVHAGAHAVVRDVFSLRFPRRLPSALRHRDALERWRGDRKLALFLDYDGTLSPIVDDPGAAALPDDTRALVRSLAQRCPVAIVSGRDRRDVAARVGLPELLYAGSHGLDIAGPGLGYVVPEAEAAIPEVNRVLGILRRTVGSVDGVVLEPKRFSLAVHYRQVDDPEVVRAVLRSVDCVLDPTRLRKRSGKQVVELEPAVDWDKGRAVRLMMEHLGLDPRDTFVVYVGDDETDEDAFAALHGVGAGIRVGQPVTRSLADYHLRDPDEVAALLRWLGGWA